MLGETPYFYNNFQKPVLETTNNEIYFVFFFSFFFFCIFSGQTKRYTTKSLSKKGMQRVQEEPPRQKQNDAKR